jgi:hypothetical protein
MQACVHREKGGATGTRSGLGRQGRFSQVWGEGGHLHKPHSQPHLMPGATGPSQLLAQGYGLKKH